MPATYPVLCRSWDPTLKCSGSENMESAWQSFRLGCTICNVLITFYMAWFPARADLTQRHPSLLTLPICSVMWSLCMCRHTFACICLYGVLCYWAPLAIQLKKMTDQCSRKTHILILCLFPSEEKDNNWKWNRIFWSELSFCFSNHSSQSTQKHTPIHICLL